MLPRTKFTRSSPARPAPQDRLPEPERQRIAKAVFDYLNNVPVLTQG